MPILSLIAAMARNHTIGQGNKLPWSLPEDHANFKKVTSGRAFIMGRLSYESEDKLLSNYRNIILSRNESLSLCANCERAGSLEKAIELVEKEKEVFILGGATVFKLALPLADKLYLTIVEAEVAGDAFFPEINWEEWREESSIFHPADERHTHPFHLKVFVRKVG